MSVLHIGTEKETVAEAALAAANLIAALSETARIVIIVDQGIFGEFTLIRYPDKKKEAP